MLGNPCPSGAVLGQEAGSEFQGPGLLSPDLFSSECDHVQGPVHEAPIQHLGAALAHHSVTGSVVGSDILAGGDNISLRSPPWETWGCLKVTHAGWENLPHTEGGARKVGRLPVGGGREAQVWGLNL